MEQHIDINFILDRSGSMGSCRGGTIEMFNGFLEGQRRGDVQGVVSLIQFDDQYEPNYFAMPLEHAEILTFDTYQPRGGTALLDAMGTTIDAIGNRLSSMNEEHRPGQVLIVIVTDGEENASQKYTTERIADMVSHQRDKYGWKFVFLGANQDAILTAKKYSIAPGYALNFNANNASATNVGHVLCAGATTTYHQMASGDASLDVFYSHQFVANETQTSVGSNGGIEVYIFEHLPILAGTMIGSIFDDTTLIYTFVVSQAGVFDFTAVGDPSPTITAGVLNLETSTMTLTWSSDPGASSVVVNYEYKFEQQFFPDGAQKYVLV